MKTFHSALVTQTQIHKHTHTVAVMKSASNFALQEKSKFITNLQAFVLGYSLMFVHSIVICI